MTINEFMEDNNHRYENMIFSYDYFTKDSFMSFADIEMSRRTKFFVPTQTFYIENDDTLFILCKESKQDIKYKDFIESEYPKDLNVMLKIDDTYVPLETYGSSDKNKKLWIYNLEEL